MKEDSIETQHWSPLTQWFWGCRLSPSTPATLHYYTFFNQFGQDLPWVVKDGKTKLVHCIPNHPLELITLCPAEKYQSHKRFSIRGEAWAEFTLLYCFFFLLFIGQSESWQPHSSGVENTSGGAQMGWKREKRLPSGPWAAARPPSGCVMIQQRLAAGGVLEALPAELRHSG